MEAKLKEAGVPSELIIKKGGGHDGALVKEYLPKMIEWFDKYLAKKGTSGVREERARFEAAAK
jgi:dipeptidyl aminopeptidase/acylaminoacyl peptidase